MEEYWQLIKPVQTNGPSEWIYRNNIFILKLSYYYNLVTKTPFSALELNENKLLEYILSRK